MTTICDTVAKHGSTGTLVLDGIGTSFYELTPINVGRECLSCKHYVNYGDGVYCVRPSSWKGYENKYETREKP